MIYLTKKNGLVSFLLFEIFEFIILATNYGTTVIPKNSELKSPK